MRVCRVCMCLSRTRIRTRRPTEDSIDASATTRARTCGTHARTHTHTHTHTPHQQNACLLGSPLVDAGHHVALEKPLTLVSARGRVCLDHRRCVFDACTNTCACTAGVSASGLSFRVSRRARARARCCFLRDQQRRRHLAASPSLGRRQCRHRCHRRRHAPPPLPTCAAPCSRHLRSPAPAQHWAGGRWKESGRGARA